MVNEHQLTPDQIDAIERLYVYDHTILVAGTGVGKTVIALTAIADLIEDDVLRKVIVACPAKVLENMIWLKEAQKWAHLNHLRIMQLEGTAQQRAKQLETWPTTQIILISLPNLSWLLDQNIDADGVVIDELSKAAGKQTAGLKSKKKAGMLKWRVGMTATPVSQNFEKLYGMCRIIDEGKALGTSKQRYLDTYFYADYEGNNYFLKGAGDEKSYAPDLADKTTAEIMGRIATLVHLMNDNKEDTLPPLIEDVREFEMPAETRKIYNEMKKDMVVESLEGFEAANQAVKTSKLRQIASGFAYAGEDFVALDTARTDAMLKWIEGLDQRPGLIFYEFIEQGHAIQGWLHFNTNIKLAQIQSMSHGIDGLQHQFADVLFYQPVWSRDLAEQAVGRVWRQGQEKSVRVTTLSCRDTLDQLVLARVSDRGRWMELFKAHLKGE